MDKVGRISLMRDAVDTVLKTMTLSDSVAIVAFSDNAQQVSHGTAHYTCNAWNPPKNKNKTKTSSSPCFGYCGIPARNTQIVGIDAIRPGQLARATSEVVDHLVEMVKNRSPDGSTNFEAAFDKAFELLDTPSEVSSGPCILSRSTPTLPWASLSPDSRPGASLSTETAAVSPTSPPLPSTCTGGRYDPPGSLICLPLAREVILTLPAPFLHSRGTSFCLNNGSDGRQDRGNCHSVIMFLTDGEPTVGRSGSDLLDGIRNAYDSHVAKGNNLVGFTYSLGNDVSGANDLMRDIACAMGGIWTAVQDGGDLRGAMGHYYEYFSQLRATGDVSRPVWVEPYIDASGAGEMTTASLAVYDETLSPPKLIAVVGVDLLTTDIKEIEPDFQSLLSALVSRSESCPNIDVTTNEAKCQRKILRETDYTSKSALFVSTATDRTCPGDAALTCSNSKDTVCPSGPPSQSLTTLGVETFCSNPNFDYTEAVRSRRHPSRVLPPAA